MSTTNQETSGIDLIAGHLTRVEQEMNQQFAGMNSRFGEVGQRFEEIDQRFEQVDERFERLERKMDRNHSELVGMLDESIRNSQRLDKERIVHAYRIDRLEQTVFGVK